MPENRLSQSASAYLQSAAHQPIDWYEFGEEAFERAKGVDRPILLDIGAVWCHWCHVIDRESYENQEIADLINAHYVAVKVDRDQRPDIDSRYQQVIASMTGQGGWPLTAFLTPDGRVIFGGTYFPPATMKKLLLQVKEVYQEKKEEMMAESLGERLSQRQPKATDTGEGEIHPPHADLPLHIVQTAQRAYDSTYGGFGRQPKFPHFSALQMLILQVAREGKTELTPMIHKTLSQMAYGGIYDHIGGGFHRYSVDAEWHVPHFEKMAYDNAEAMVVYSQAYRLTGDPLFKDVVEGIQRFVAEVLSDQENGGFYASQDADIDLEDDGDYFTWSLEEINAILTPEEARVVTAYYNLTPDGDMHGRPGRNVLRIKAPLATHEAMLNMTESEMSDHLASAYEKMNAARWKRPQPFVDKSQYLNWNGMMLVGYFEAADLLEDQEEELAFAVKTLNRLRLTHVDPVAECLLHAPGIPGFMEDYAWFIAALLKGYQSTAKPEYLQEARHWADVARSKFEDNGADSGGFYDIEDLGIANAPALLKLRRRPVEDTPSSSANAVMIQNMLTLSMMEDNPEFDRSARRALGFLTHPVAQHGFYVSALGISLFNALTPPLKLEVVGHDQALRLAARRVFSPGKIVTYAIEGKTSEIRVCQGTRCLPPVTSPDALEAALQSL